MAAPGVKAQGPPQCTPGRGKTLCTLGGQTLLSGSAHDEAALVFVRAGLQPPRLPLAAFQHILLTVSVRAGLEGGPVRDKPLFASPRPSHPAPHAWASEVLTEGGSVPAPSKEAHLFYLMT